MSDASHKEKIVSGLGGFASIFTAYWITLWFEHSFQLQLLFVASMGSSAVLLFATPRVALAQPWNVIGGHLVSAIIGIAIHYLLPDPYFAGGIAVGLAITAMYYLRCLHPPGGATVLFAVIGGAPVDAYGLFFVLFPVGLGAAIMVLVAIIFNYPFAWRQYPVALFPGDVPEHTSKDHDPAYPDITHSDLVSASPRLILLLIFPRMIFCASMKLPRGGRIRNLPTRNLRRRTVTQGRRNMSIRITSTALLAAAFILAAPLAAKAACLKKGAKATASTEKSAKWFVMETIVQQISWGMWPGWVANGTTPGYKVSGVLYKCKKGGGGVTCIGQATFCEVK